jgi:hypothetical protein
MLSSVAASQAPLPNLFISLAFGVGQVVIGTAMVIYTARKERWRQITFFGLALIGAWIVASGVTELVVSGTELLARLSGTISVTTAQQIRASADMAFLDASLVLIAAGVAYLLLARRWIARPGPAGINTDKRGESSARDRSATDREPAAEATSTEARPAEPEG